MKKTTMLLIVCLMACLLSGSASLAAEPPKPAMSRADLDLSRLSGTVVYSQIYNMMTDPEPYLGMVIKIAGYYSYYEDTERGEVYHACVIPDATACCAQGIEFVWAGEHVWPDAYPQAETDIVVTGRLAEYEEDGYMYLHLVDADLVWERDS